MMRAGSPIISLADCRVDSAQQIVVRADRRVHLTTREIELLLYLIDHPGRTITREELLEQVWGHPRHGSIEPVYSTIKRLRAKIEGPSAHRHIVTVHGEGYRFEPPPAVAPAAGPLPPHGPAPSARPLGPERTRFVGRLDELGAIDACFARGARLVTLLGPGGVGKTRVAREHQRHGARGPMWFCDLSEARDAASVLRAIAAALGLPLDGDAPDAWARGLGRALEARAALAPDAVLILDNAEQVRAPLAEVIAGWLDFTRTLVTSRERLHLAGEHVIDVGPLPEDEAVELFIDRARMASGAFDPTPERVAAVRAIVARLDRLPLAIELAAARTNLLRPEALLARLDNQLDALARNTVDGTPRHATLRAAVDWSWQLLGPDERCVLGQCAVFSGGFTAEAAEAVVALPDRGDAGPTRAGVYQLLARLRDRSLIRPVDVPELPEQARFMLYAAVRQFAGERVEDRGAVEARHGAWVADECERWVADLDGRGHARARAHLEVELDNLQAAFAAGLDAPAGDARAGRVGVIGRLLDAALRLRGAVATRRAVLEQAVARAASDADRAGLCLSLGELLEGQGLRGDASLARARELARVEGLAPIAAAAAASLGQAQAARGDFAGGVAAIEAAVDEARAAGARVVEGRALAALGEVLWRGGRVPEARAALERAADCHRDVGDLRFAAQTAGALCHVLRADGRLAEALASLDAAERGFELLGDPVGRARTRVDRGLHLSRVGRQRDAVAALEEAGALYEQLGLSRGRVEVHLNLAEALLGLGEDARALHEVHLAVAACRELGERVRLPIALELLACAAVLAGDITSAENALFEALTIAQAADTSRSEATILAKRGLCHFLRRRFPEALEDFAASESLHALRGATSMAGTSAADRAVAYAAVGQLEQARAAAARARALLGDPPDTHWTGRMLTLLEAATDALARAAGGAARDVVRADGLAVRAAVLAHMPRDAQDLATRLSCLMLDHVLDHLA